MKRHRRQVHSDDDEDDEEQHHEKATPEDQEEEEDSDHEAAVTKTRKRLKSSKFLEEEAEVESDDDANFSEDEDEVEDEEEDAEALAKQMIADDEDVEREMAEADRHGRGGKKGESTADLVDDDYLLLEEHHGVRFRRRKKTSAAASTPDAAAEDDEDAAAAASAGEKRRRLRKQTEHGRAHDAEYDRDEAMEHRDEDYGLSDDDGDGFIVDDIGGGYGGAERSRGVGAAGFGAAGDIFGDMSEFLQQAPLRPGEEDDSQEQMEMAEEDDEVAAASASGAGTGASPVKMRTIDPSIAAKHFVTEKDEEIRRIDLPERMQQRIAERPVAEGDPKEVLVAEAEWMHALKWSSQAPEEVVPAILHVLHFLREENLEVPYIQTFQRDYYMPLSEDDIWVVDEYDQRWDRLVAKRQAFSKVIERLDQGDIELSLLAEGAADEDDLDDIRAYFKDRLRGRPAPAHAGDDAATVRRPVGRVGDGLDGLDGLVRQLFLEPRQLGENLRSQFLKHCPVDPEQTPLEVAATLVSSRYPEPAQVLAAARNIAASRLMTDPFVRGAIRSRFRRMALVSTEPTQTGLSTIDWVHEYYPVKRLVQKPVIRFEVEHSPQFALLRKAEAEGFIRCRFEVPRTHQHQDEVLDALGVDLLDLFVSGGLSSVSQQWNQQRRLVFQTLLEKHLYPLAEKSVRQRLVIGASERVCELAAARLGDILGVAPLCTQHSRLIACAVGQRSEPSYVVSLNQHGVPIDHLVLHSMKTPARGGGGGDSANATAFGKTRGDQKGSDSKLFREFVERQRGSFVAVSASSMEARNFMEEASKALVGVGAVVEYVDGAVAAVAMNSRHMTDAETEPELAVRPPLYRYAVALGRLLLHPLATVAGVATDDADLLSLHLHPLQTEVPRQMLLAALHRVLCSVTSSVGVHLNRCVAYPHLAAPLRFVGGLGPRKAKVLTDSISRRGGLLVCRDDLFSRGILGPCVYRNAVAFLRVIPSPEWPSVSGTERDADEVPHPLDDTRIHPELYVLADRVVLNALDADADDDARCGLVHRLRRGTNLSHLEDLDLEAYAEVMEAEGEGRHHKALQLVKNELRCGFKEVRRARQAPTDERLFSLLTGETPGLTIHIGQVVDAHVVRCLRNGLTCRLDSGLPGFVHINDVDVDVDAFLKDHGHEHDVQGLDERELASAALRYRFVGAEALRCRVKMVQPSRFRLELTARRRDLEARLDWEVPPITDEYLVVTPEDEAALLAVASTDGASAAPKRKFVPRTIDHPAFFNVEREAAEARLAERPCGDVVIRPSSSGPNFVTITWKCSEDVYVHVSVREEDKPNEVKQALGRRLYIGKEAYDDLDEILERYIRPIATNAAKITGHNKFYLGSMAEVDETLRDEKEDKAKSIPYFLCASDTHPGTFVLAFQPGSRPRHEPIRVVTDGYRFRSQLFPSIDKLLSWFKRHALDGPTHGGRPQRNGRRRQQQQPRVPARVSV